MAYIKQAKTEDEIKKLTIANVKKAYNELAKDYNRLVNLDYIICPVCGEPVSSDNFYTDRRFAIGVFPECKKCIRMEVEQRKNKSDKPNETKESVMKMLQKMDIPYIDSLYESLRKDVADEINEKNKTSPFLAYLPPIKSLPQYKGKTYADSEFGDFISEDEEEINENSRILKSAKKRFGNGFSNSELVFLENEYQDWTRRYQCENKAQELLFKRVCFKELDIDKAQKEGRDTKELDKTLQELLGSLNLKPSQNNSNALTESKTFGQLIEKWENEKPIPEPDDNFKDVDRIGLYIDVFFKGHLSKMMGLKNGFSSLYEKFMHKYTVKRPEYDEDTDSEVLFEQIFGAKADE